MATEDKTYNGWTNYETWAIALWIGNEEGSYNYWEKEQAEECYREAVEEKHTEDTIAFDRADAIKTASLNLADRLKGEFEEGKDNLLETAKQTASVWADLLGAALSEVNWYEIAKNYVGGVDHAEIEQEVTEGEEAE